MDDHAAVADTAAIGSRKECHAVLAFVSLRLAGVAYAKKALPRICLHWDPCVSVGSDARALLLAKVGLCQEGTNEAATMV